jgi:hypothetical protein
VLYRKCNLANNTKIVKITLDIFGRYPSSVSIVARCAIADGIEDRVAEGCFIRNLNQRLLKGEQGWKNQGIFCWRIRIRYTSKS